MPLWYWRAEYKLWDYLVERESQYLLMICWRTLYFLLGYLTKAVPLHKMSWALQYLDKAAAYFGMLKQQINDFKPFYNSYEKVASHIKQIKNRQILESMISNCSNIFILMSGDEEQKQIGKQAYKLYEELGFSYEEVRYIVNKYMYRTDI